MRSVEQAQTDAAYHAAQLVDALQDADADDMTIQRAEAVQSMVDNAE